MPLWCDIRAKIMNETGQRYYICRLNRSNIVPNIWVLFWRVRSEVVVSDWLQPDSVHAAALYGLTVREKRPARRTEDQRDCTVNISVSVTGRQLYWHVASSLFYFILFCCFSSLLWLQTAEETRRVELTQVERRKQRLGEGEREQEGELGARDCQVNIQKPVVPKL